MHNKSNLLINNKASLLLYDHERCLITIHMS